MSFVRICAGVVTAVAALTLGSPESTAATREGVTMKDTITVAGEQLQLNGMGVRLATVMNVKVYVAGLYVESPTSQPQEIIGSKDPKHLALSFVRDVEKGDIVKAWKEGFAKNNDEKTVQTLKPRIDQLNGWMTNMKKGESLVFTYIPQKGTQVAVAGQIKGTIPGDDFARALFSIWLGPNPPNQELKAGLLGKEK